MRDAELSRYSRHILLNEIGIEGQQRINAARVLVIGAGGLASPAVLYLAAAGVGSLTVVDDDVVDLTNLQRQIMHSSASVGSAKVLSAQSSAARINPLTRVVALQQRADAALLDAQVPQADVVLDCTDNFTTRHAINAACVRHRVPLVSGAAVQFDGQISVFDPRRADCPCYACAFPSHQAPDAIACATMGVFAPVVGVIGCMQAAQALMLVGAFGTPLTGVLLMLDGRSMEWSRIGLPRDPACSVCAPP
ncbi:MAG: molybdopterin-synthase adenylyltransferase MoeB [Betaproteobacteria bacterium]|jgi:molybdopterin/thiamine biosynthesis adenylyltransferase|nr:molybdopterin-synthase adenylyltransferase MoeB [Betaproteobacteria bacterium]